MMASDGMPGFTPNAALIMAEIARVRQSRTDLLTIAAHLDHALQTLEDCLERGDHGASKVYLMHRSTPRLSHIDAAAEHRLPPPLRHPVKTDHRPRPARVRHGPRGTKTFDDIVTEVAATCPPERRISRSSLSRWWVKNKPEP